MPAQRDRFFYTLNVECRRTAPRSSRAVLRSMSAALFVASSASFVFLWKRAVPPAGDRAGLDDEVVGRGPAPVPRRVDAGPAAPARCPPQPSFSLPLMGRDDALSLRRGDTKENMFSSYVVFHLMFTLFDQPSRLVINNCSWDSGRQRRRDQNLVARDERDVSAVDGDLSSRLPSRVSPWNP